MSKILDLIYRVTDKATPGIKKIKTEQASLTSEMKKAALTMGAVAGVAATLKGIWDQTVVPVMAYNKAMKDLSQTTGVAVEDLSRLVQVGDDVGITAEAMGKAFEMATKKGFAVSVDSLADLADKTNAMNSPTERAAYLAEIFGKNWAALVPLLEKGGKNIREMTAAQLAGLVTTEKEIAMTEELRLALDEIADEWTAIKNEIGLGVGGALVKGRRDADEFAKGMNQALAVVRAQGIEPTRNNIDAMFRALTDGRALAQIFAIRDALNELDGKTISVNINGYGSNYMPVGSHGSAGGYGQYVNNPSGWNTPLEGAGGIQYRQVGTWPDGSPKYEPMASGGPVSSGGSYVVGEKGPELFTPGQSGNITSNEDMGQLTQEIRRMLRTLPVIMRDAVQKQ